LKILFFGYLGPVFGTSLARQLKARWPGRLSIDILSTGGLTRPEELQDVADRVVELCRRPGWAFRLPLVRTGLRRRSAVKELRALDRHYDVCSLQFMQPSHLHALKDIRHIARHVTLTVWGSDYYRRSPKQRDKCKQLAHAVDRISCANNSMIRSLESDYGLPPDKLYHCRFGLAPIEALRQIQHLSAEECKEQLGISQRLVVACGYNGRPEQQHLAILESLLRARPRLTPDMLLLVPLTYGGTPEYLDVVERAYTGSGFDCRFYRNFLSDAEIAVMRKAADVMIQVQPTDQLSGGMTEHMYAGSMVITGSWLPYDDIRERRVSFLTVDAVCEVGDRLAKYWAERHDYAESLRQNPDRISPLVSWDENIQSWIDFFSFPEGACGTP
jgi:hypothetical protein